MAGELHKAHCLDAVLSGKEIEFIINKALGMRQWKLLRTEYKAASDGIVGFLGDHMKGVLSVEAGGEATALNVFIKRLPIYNNPKVDFITENCFNKRERLLFSLVEEFEEQGSNPCVPKAYLYSDELLVLPDLSVQGYSSRHYLETLDLPHVLVTVASLARFHAAYANYATKKSRNGIPYNILNDHGDIMREPIYKESPWLQTAAKVAANVLETFSSKHKIADLENVLNLYFVKACESLKDYEDTVNVLLHKDLWINNIMFKYEEGVPVNAILVDFQCMRYGPPAFDLMVFLYMTTSRIFREKYEREVLSYYFKIFCKSLDECTKQRIKIFGYDEEEFLDWCDRSRMFGMVQALAILPFARMDSKTAQKTFDDPETFEKYNLEDRSEPVIAHANKCSAYRDMQVEVGEEFIERYVLEDGLKQISE